MFDTKILVVEDENIVAKDLQYRLKRLGYAVPFVVASGEDAIQCAHEIRPDVVLMDIVLKGDMDGIEAATEIVKRLDIPVIFLTAYSDDNMIERVKGLQPLGYLLKPFQERELHATIQAGLYRRDIEKRLKESENRFHVALKNAPLVVLNQNCDLRYTWVYNPLGNISAAEILDKTDTDLFIPEDAANFIAFKRGVLEAGVGARAELRLTTLDQQIHFFDVTAEPMRDHAGHIIGVMCASLDITASKLAADAVKNSETRHRIVAENTFGWEFWMDPNSQPLYISPSCERLTGYTREEFLADPSLFARIVHPDDVPQFLEHNQRIKRDHLSTPIEYRIICKDGAERWLGHVCQPVYDAAGNYLGVRGSNRDITARKQMETQLRHHAEHAETLANISHLIAQAGLDVSAILNTITEQISQTLGEVCLISLLSHDSKFLEHISIHHPQFETTTALNQIFSVATHRADEGMMGQVIKTGKPVAVSPLTRAQLRETVMPEFWNDLEEYHFSSALIVPICIRDQIMGTLSVLRLEPNPPFTRDDQIFLQAVADRAALMIGNARLHAQVTRARDELEQRVQERTTALRQANAALAASEARFRMLAENAQDLIYRYRLTDPPGFEYISPSATRITGYTPEEHYANPDLGFKHVHPNDRHLLETLTRGQGAPTDLSVLRWCRKDGTLIWTEQRNLIIRNDEGTAIAIEGIARDITERKLAEQAMQESEEKYRSVVASLQEGVVLQDTSGEILTANASAERILGLSLDQLRGRTSVDPRWQAIHEDGSPFPGETHPGMVTLRTGKPQTNVMMGVHKPDGTLSWISINSQPIYRSGESSPFAIVATFADFTPRKNMEDALRESEQRFRRVLENSFDAAYSRNLQTDTYDYMSPAITQITGYSLEQVLASTTQDVNRLVHPDDLERINQIVHDALVGTRQHHTIEYRARHQNGQYHWYRDLFTIVKDAQGTPLYRIGSLSDITDARRAEESLRASEKKYRQLIELAQEGVWAIDNQANTTFVNPRMAEMLGYAPAEMLGRSLFDFMDDAGQAQAELFLERRRRGITEQHDFEFIRQDGQHIYTSLETTPLTADDDRYIGALALVADITARRRAEDALRESEERFRLITETIDDVFWMANNDISKIFYVSPAYELVWGHARARVYENPRAFLEAIHPRDMPNVLADFDRARQNRLPFDHEYRILRPDGEIRWLWDRGFPLKNKRGEITHYVGVAKDITERKHGEEALHESDENQHAILNSTTDSVFLMTSDGILLALNEATAQKLGKQVGDLLGKSIYAVLPPAEIESRRQSIAQAIQTGVPVHFIDQRLGRWLDNNLFPIFDLQGRVTRLAVYERDITEAMAVEEKVRKTTARMAALVQTASRLNAKFEFQTVLQTVCKEAARALNLPAAIVVLNNERNEDMTLAGEHGLPREYRERFNLISRAGYDRLIHKYGVVFAVTACQAEDEFAELGAGAKAPPGIIASMYHDEQLIGMLYVLALTNQREFTEDDLALAKGLADQAALAIENARSLETAQRRLRQLQTLHGIDQAISASFDLRVTLRLFLLEAMHELQVDAIDVLLLEPHSQTLTYSIGRGFHHTHVEQTQFRLGDGADGLAVLEHRTLFVPNLKAFPNLRHFDWVRAEGFVAYCGVPLIAKGKILGMLNLFQRKPLDFESEFVQFIETLGGQLAIAIDNSILVADLERSHADLITAYDTTLEGWSRALDLRDKETEGHTQRVTDMTVKLARSAGMSEAEIVQVRRGALLHDIGKIGIPDEILLKPDALTDEEWTIMRRHPALANELLMPIPYLRPALDIPLYHHEKWDGSGYPHGLKGEAIPLAARLFAIVDFWDALRSDRPYRLALTETQVRQMVVEGSGSHFDPRVVKLFLQMVERTNS